MKFIAIVLFVLLNSLSSFSQTVKEALPQDTIIKDSCEVLIPDYFHAHGDCVNDQFCVYGKCIKEMDLKIFDRWGTLIFESNDQKKCWGGTTKGKACPPGTYFYVLHALLFTTKEIEMKGNISLLR
ncbi:MAG: hypothetical protein K0S32_603 [Bacteroidetes bacterium]|jgi:gliding motility-associated-like protein|nr:hypothetical protein [Bacteroidota bacterium]